LNISPATIGIAPGSLAPASRSVPYAAVLTGSGGTAPYSFAVTGGVLPAGLALGSAGTLSGTPGAVGSFTFTVTATDANASVGSRTYTLNVNIATLDISPGVLIDATPGNAYSQVFSGTGGAAPYSFALANGSSLPPGLVISSNGSLTGIPSGGGQFSFSITMTDATSATVTRAFNLDVVLIAVHINGTGTLPSGTYATSYDQAFVASGGTAPYTYALAGGALPGGLVLSSAGELMGTPTVSGTFSFSVKAVDAYGDTGTYPFTLSIAPATIAMTPDDLFAATSGLFYSATIAASGGVGPYTYALSAGALPNGLSLASNGTISGIPNAAPVLYTFTVRATDAGGATGTKIMTLKLATPLILVDSFALPIATVGVTYLRTVSVTGGNAPYTYSLSDGVLPTGLALTTDGKITGSPKTPGTTTFTILIIDANGITSEQSFRLVVQKHSAKVTKKKPPKKTTHAKKKKKKAKANKH
jgi:hypothetical protein